MVHSTQLLLIATVFAVALGADSSHRQKHTHRQPAKPVSVAETSFDSQVGTWVTTSGNRACEANQEGVVRTGARASVPSAAACRTMCEQRSSCTAVDFYEDTKFCLFYEDACTTPLSMADGASSYHLKRASQWSVIDKSAACEVNEESIHYFDALQGPLSLEACQQECTRRSSCRAVDFFTATGFCSFYSEPCQTPQARHNGAGSYQIAQQLETQTVKEMKQASLAVAKGTKAWSVIQEGKSCQENDEGIKPLGDGSTVADLAACRQQCENHKSCAAIDYYAEKTYCVLYPQACVNPQATHNTPSAWRLVGSPLVWKTISSQSACQSNKEGVQQANAGMGVPSFQACKSQCEARSDCMAVDFYHSTRWCINYNEACTTPTATADGASSHRIVRTKSLPKQVGFASMSVDASSSLLRQA